MPKTIKIGRKRKARKIRKSKGVQKNPDGSVSTHLMSTYTGGKKGKKHFVAPTIAPDKKGVYKPQSFDQALKRGEVFEFRSKKKADKFARGSWKK